MTAFAGQRAAQAPTGGLVPEPRVLHDLYVLRHDLRSALATGNFQEVDVSVRWLGYQGQVVALSGFVNAAQRDDFIKLISSFAAPQLIMFGLGACQDQSGRLSIKPIFDGFPEIPEVA